MRKLSELYPNCDDTMINEIKINSKEVQEGDIFVCTHGVTADRHDFIEEAIQNGAKAIVVEKDVNATVPTIKVENTNKELPLLASRFYNHPEEKLEIIGITGTNGKTTVASIIQDLIGKDICGYLGTNGLIYQDVVEPIRNTTPDADRLYKYFDRFVQNGCKFLSMETSSEAFYRERLQNITFKVGVITNITEDHLNIHKTIENYVACKKELLKQVAKDGYSILNTEDKYYLEFREIACGTILTYGKQDATLKIIEINEYEDFTHFKVLYNQKEYDINSPLLGEFNVYNLCAGILTLIALGYQMEEIIPNIKNIKVPNGRVEFLNFNQNYKIVLDYAHTPDAFSKIYPFLQKIKKNRIITVTGSAGGREKEKRGPMGKIVLDNSDYVIFTMDDPRLEDVNAIIDDLVSNATTNNYERIIDRKEAIFHALDIAEEDDIILIAGKGTDNYMALGNEYLPYSDLEVIKEYFSKE